VKNPIALSVALGLALFFSSPAQADVTIKLGTLAPEGSQWHNLLREIGEQWSQVSNGKVKMKIYPGGVVGNESDMVRKLRVSQLQAALLTGTGIRDIEPAVQTLQVPMMLTNNDELDYVLDKMAPAFEKALLDKGFVALFWGDAGWVAFLTQKPVHTPEDMHDEKVFAWAGDEGAVEAWKIAGFKPVVISATDITTSLQTGMIQAVDTTPLAALSFQWYRYARNMTNVKWAPLVGSLLVSKKTWEQIPADIRGQCLKIAQDIGKKVKLEGRQMGEDAIAQMKKDGLTVIDPSPKDISAWRAAAEKAYPYIRENVVPTAVFDQVKKYRDEYRTAHPGG
jgi:TRAP-type C4-dicarboxylate transport system substrate-binding protein